MRSSTAVATLAALLSMGCDAPTASDAAAPVSIVSAAAPANSGNSGVFRVGQEFLLRFDFATPDGLLIVRHYQADDIDFCGGSSPLPTVQEMLVTDPNAVNAVFEAFFKARDIPVFIYRPNDTGKDLCEYLVQDWIYKGTANVLRRDNNLFGDVPTNRTNAYGWQGQGSLTDQAGNHYRFIESGQVTVITPDFSTVRVFQDGLQITPAH